MMNILVTGSNGQLGKTFAELSSKWPEFKFVFKNRAQLDITNKENIEHIFEEVKPKFVLNCAAYTAVDKAEIESDLAFEINGLALDHLAVMCKKYKSTLIHFSSDYVYHPWEESQPMEELYACTPKSVYAKSKYEGEQQIIQSNVPSIILRTSWVYSDYDNNFVRTMLRLSQSHDSLRIVNDQVGAPTHTKDIAETCVKMIRAIETGKFNLTSAEIYNYAGEGKISWFDFALEIFRQKKIKIQLFPIPSSEYPTPAKRPKWSVMDMTKIKKDFGIAPVWWKERLKETLEKL